MTPPHDVPPPAEDPAVAAEWRRIEAARLAEERAEAREDAEQASHVPAVQSTKRRWPLVAFGVALAAGVVLAILVNRPQVQPAPEAARVTNQKRPSELWAEANRIDEAALRTARVRRVASTAAVPAEQLLIRVGIRDPQGRERLESLLAASGLRIESDRGRPTDEVDAVVVDSLVISGRPADVDALLDRLIASPAMLEVVSPGLVAVVPGPGQEQSAAEITATPSQAIGSAPADRVRVRVEVLDLPVDAPPIPPRAPDDAR